MTLRQEVIAALPARPRYVPTFGGKRWMGGNAHGGRWRGKLPIPARAPAIVRKLFEIMNKEMTTIRDVAARSGCFPSTISDWRYRRSPSLKEFEAAVNALGYDLRIVQRRETEE